MSRAVADTKGLIGKTLRQVELFSSWSDEALDALAQAAGLRQYDQGEVVAEAGGPATGVFVIVRGALLNCRSWESGKYTLMAILHPNWPLKVAAAWDGHHLTHARYAESRCVYL